MIDLTENRELVIRAMGELLITVLAMHMTPESLAQAAFAFRARADEHDTRASLGISTHPASPDADPALWRVFAEFYEAARTESLSHFSGVRIPAPGHIHERTPG